MKAKTATCSSLFGPTSSGQRMFPLLGVMRTCVEDRGRSANDCRPFSSYRTDRSVRCRSRPTSRGNWRSVACKGGLHPRALVSRPTIRQYSSNDNRSAWPRRRDPMREVGMHDIVIRGGTIIDGTGKAGIHRRRGDRRRPDRGGRRQAGSGPARDRRRRACWSRPAGSTCTRITTARRCGTRCWRRRAGTASPR